MNSDLLFGVLHYSEYSPDLNPPQLPSTSTSHKFTLRQLCYWLILLIIFRFTSDALHRILQLSYPATPTLQQDTHNRPLSTFLDIPSPNHSSQPSISTQHQSLNQFLPSLPFFRQNNSEGYPPFKQTTICPTNTIVTHRPLPS